MEYNYIVSGDMFKDYVEKSDNNYQKHSLNTTSTIHLSTSHC